MRFRSTICRLARQATTVHPKTLTLALLALLAHLIALVPPAAQAEGLTVVAATNADGRWNARIARLEEMLGKGDSLFLTQDLVGGWNEIVEGLKGGWIDFAVLPLAALQLEVPATAAWYLPFIQVSPREAETAVEESGALKKLQALSENRGWPILGIFAERRILLSTHDCPSAPADFQGRKIVSSPAYHPLIAELGAVPFHLPGGEVFSSLEKGIGTLTLVSVETANAANLQSIAIGVPDPKNKPMTLGWYAFVASPVSWNDLKPAVRQEIVQLATSWIEEERTLDEQEFDIFYETLNEESQLCEFDATSWADFIELYWQHMRTRNYGFNELLDLLFDSLPPKIAP